MVSNVTNIENPNLFLCKSHDSLSASLVWGFFFLSFFILIVILSTRGLQYFSAYKIKGTPRYLTSNSPSLNWRISKKLHCFKNRTKSAGSTANRCSVRFDSLKKPEIRKKWSKTENWQFDRENRESDRLNWFWPSSSYSKT